MRKPKTIFVVVLLCVILSGILFAFYVHAKISTIKTLRSSIDQIQGENQAFIEAQRDDISNLYHLIPDTSDSTGFIENIYRISKKYEIADLSFEQRKKEYIEMSSGRIVKALPRSGEKPRVVYSYPVTVSFKAVYRNCAEFIREIQNQTRLVTIESLTINQDKEFLAVDMVMNIYSREDL